MIRMTAIFLALTAALAGCATGTGAPAGPAAVGVTSDPRFTYPTLPDTARVRLVTPEAGSVLPAGPVAFHWEATGVKLGFGGGPDIYHVHVLVDIDPTEYVGTRERPPGLRLPGGVIHLFRPEDTPFTVELAPGTHTAIIYFANADHTSAHPPLAQTVTFSVK